MTHTVFPKAINILQHAKEYSEDVVRKARQLVMLTTPLSKLVETYLFDTGRLQNLAKFPMMRHIYDTLPQKTLLKCSRKTLKSTLLSNVLTLNLIRYDYYNMLYLAPQEATTKLFSNSYLDIRLESAPFKRISGGLETDEVYQKIMRSTKSTILLKYASDDATRCRGPATDLNVHDEVQDMCFDILPIVRETMALSRFKREIFAGTPLTTDNTINEMWKKTNQCEWYFKCEHCNHWNALVMDNEPLKMIREEGLSCSKCSRPIYTENGEWIETNPGKYDMTGFHLAQPILPFFNRDKKQWKEIYNKITGGNYSLGQIYNEVFGLAYDTGKKPIDESHLKSISILGKSEEIHPRNAGNYCAITCGVDWGVNPLVSRTTCCIGGMKPNGIYEVFFSKIYKDFDYANQIRDITARVKYYNAFVASDAQPDPVRGITLGEHVGWDRNQLVRYTDDKFIQKVDQPNMAIHPSQFRWCLHRSDTMTFTFNLLKDGKILFPNWDEVSECMQDILNIYIETKEIGFSRKMYYRHGAEKPDDYFHALNFAVIQAHLVIGNPLLMGPSTSDNTTETGSLFN